MTTPVGSTPSNPFPTPSPDMTGNPNLSNSVDYPTQPGQNVSQDGIAGTAYATGASSAPLLNANTLYSPYVIQPVDAVQTTDITQPNINALLQPPTLGTFVYSPNIRIVIAHGLVQYDVSADVVSFQLIREENSAATLLFTLQNAGLRYTPVGLPPLFSRMDRIVVYMFKTAWVQTFAGYLDTVPYKQLYAGPVDFKATCTIKRLMHTWVDPALPAVQEIFSMFSSYEQAVQGDGAIGSNIGYSGLLEALLVLVGNWSPTNIHIQNFPLNFLTFINQQITAFQTADNNNTQNLETMLLGSNLSPGPGAYAGYNSNAGPPGPYAPTGTGDTGPAGDTFYIPNIVAAADRLGLGPEPLDNSVAAGLAEAGAEGETNISGGIQHDPQSNQAWSTVQDVGTSMEQANRNSDGAILGVAAAMMEGHGTIRNPANLAAVGSSDFPNDGLTTVGSGCGIFLLQNSWGPAAQRMNPLQAAGMFMTKLAKVQGWRNMDPGQAIQIVLNTSSDSAPLFDWFIGVATKVVHAYRESDAAGVASETITAGVPGTSVSASSLLGSNTAGLGGAPSLTGGNAVVGGVTSMPNPAMAAGLANPTTAASPQPNSEGAINFARLQISRPYVWGGTGPAGYDCSGLVYEAFRSIGVSVGRGTYDIPGTVPRVPTSDVQRGDIVLPTPSHEILWLGDGTIIEAPNEGSFVQQVVNPYPPSSWYGVFRACMNGGPNPSAPFNPAPWTAGPGTPPSALDQIGGVYGAGNPASQEPVARNLFSYLFQPMAFASQTAAMFQGEKAFIEGEPLLQLIQAVAGAGLRCWSSAPNGDFIAWYPDYFGLDGKPAVLALADIELKDVTINFSDDPLTTHVYVNGDWLYGLNMDSAQSQLNGWMSTGGVATVEDPFLFARITAVAPSDLDEMNGQEIMQRFGVRPLKQVFSMAGTPALELMLAIQIFQQKWAQQYQTVISMTFMPELFPGMRVELLGHNLQVYVSGVTHTGSYTEGFSTQATIFAPSNLLGKTLMRSVNTAFLPDPNNAFGFSDGNSQANVQNPFSTGGSPTPINQVQPSS